MVSDFWELEFRDKIDERCWKNSLDTSENVLCMGNETSGTLPFVSFEKQVILQSSGGLSCEARLMLCTEKLLLPNLLPIITASLFITAIIIIFYQSVRELNSETSAPMSSALTAYLGL